MDETGPDREEIMPTAALERAAPAFQIEEDGDDLVVRIPKSLASRDRLERWLAWMELEEIASRSQLTEEAAHELASEVKRAVWEANRHRFEAS